MQDLLVFADNYRTWNRGVEYACELAAASDANLTAVFVAEPITPLPSMSLPAAFPDLYTITAGILREAREAETAFAGWASGFGAKRSQWVVAEGYVAAALSHAANWNDALVLCSGGESPWGMPGPLGQIILTCGVACFVVPANWSHKASARRIAIAWNGSIEAMRAIHAALPLLQAAEHVLLIEGKRDETFVTLEWVPAFSIEGYLARHNVRFKKTMLDGPDEKAGDGILRRAH
ncbi:MAG TPA: hypothetical protein VF132_08175, partial [Rudaea sp.]